MTLLDRPRRTAAATPSRGWARSVAASPAALPCLVVVAVVVAANIAYIAGVFDANPLAQYAGLTSHLQTGPLPGHDNIDPNLGYTSQALGHLAAMDWLHGHVPWWNPFEGLGMPLAGEMQSAALFPLVLLDAFANGQIYFRLILEVTAGLSMLFLLRRLVTSRWAATAGAVVFALNGTFAWMFHSPGNPVAFAPLLLLGIEQARSPRGRWLTGWPLIALALALSIYAGFPEVAFIDFLLAVLWAAVRASQARGRELLEFVGRLAAGAVTGALLAAPILVAFLTFSAHADLLGHAGGKFANAFMTPSVTVPAVAMPYVYGPIFAWLRYETANGAVIAFWGNIGGYLGAVMLVLGLVGLVGKPERRLRLVLGAWLVLAIGRTVGMTGAIQIVNAVPGVKDTAFYRYSPPSWTLAACVLAVLAIDDLARQRRRVVVAAAGILSLAAIAFLKAWSNTLQRMLGRGPHHWDWQLASVAFAALMIVACVAAAVLLRGRRARAAALSCLLAFEALAFFVIPEFSAPRSATVDTAPVRFLQAHLGQQRFTTLGPIDPNYGSYWQVATVNLNDLPVRDYSTYVEKHLDTNVSGDAFTGTVMTDLSGATPRQELLAHLASYEDSGVKYVLQPHGWPPLVVAGRALPVVFSDPVTDITELPSPAPFQTATGGGCKVVSSGPDRAVATCTGAGTLIRREQYLPGWDATDGGRSVTVSAYRTVFQQVPLRPGRNVVSFSFTPPHTDLGVVAAACALAALVATLILRGSPRRFAYTPAHRRRPDRPRG